MITFKDVTYASHEHFKTKSFEIIMDVFHKIVESKEFTIKEFLIDVGEDELYESLKYHFDTLNSAITIKNYELLDDFLVWKYSNYASRGLDTEYIKKEHEFWLASVLKFLYLAHSSEIKEFYEYMIKNHTTYIQYSREIKAPSPKKEFEGLFDTLLVLLLSAKEREFYDFVEKNLYRFNGDIFVFLQEIGVILMQRVGYMWQIGSVSVAKEHLATSTLNNIIESYLQPSRQKPKYNSRVLLCNVAGETHSLGLKIVSKYLQHLGYEVQFLSSGLTQKELIKSVYELNPDTLILSCTLSANLATLKELVDELSSNKEIFQGKIILGGQAVSYLKEECLGKTVQCSTSLEQFKTIFI